MVRKRKFQLVKIFLTVNGGRHLAGHETWGENTHWFFQRLET